jgi:predicted hydrocarbon binding protein
MVPWSREISRPCKSTVAPGNMTRTEVPGTTVGSAPAGGSTITPLFPLLVLQTMRDMDRPEEVLEDEDVSVSLPRRLGLSDVVGRQIYRLQEEVRRRRHQPAVEVEDLIRLMIRRPDAEKIFREAGRRMAVREWEERAPPVRRAVRWMPRRLALVSAIRAARRLFRQIVGGGKLRIQRGPVEMRISSSFAARVDPGGSACAFYTGALEQLLTFYTQRDYRALHAHCEARGDDYCEWTVRVS